MGLLRACADVVLIASGTMLASPAGTWRPERVYPPAAAGFAELRRRLQLPERPTLACVTSGRTFDPTHPALRQNAIVLTTKAAAAGLRARVPSATEVVATNSGDSVDLELGLQALRERGHSLIVTEGGPTLFGSLITAGLVNELCLTISPLLAGRARKRRLALVEESSCSRTWHTDRASSRCGDRQTISSSATRCSDNRRNQSSAAPRSYYSGMVLFPIAIIWLGLVIYWAIRRADAEPTDEPPTGRWSKRPTPPRRGPNRRAPYGSGGRRRYERSA